MHIKSLLLLLGLGLLGDHSFENRNQEASRLEKTVNYSQGVQNTTKQDATDWIPPGDYAFSTGKELASKGFYVCSAVIWDYKDTAFLGHVFTTPLSDHVQDPWLRFNVTNVIDTLDSVVRDHGFNPRHGFAIIYTGYYEVDHIQLLEDLQRLGISTLFAGRNKDYRCEHSVRYDPITNRLAVTYEHDCKKYSFVKEFSEQVK